MRLFCAEGDRSDLNFFGARLSTRDLTAVVIRLFVQVLRIIWVFLLACAACCNIILR